MSCDLPAPDLSEHDHGDSAFMSTLTRECVDGGRLGDGMSHHVAVCGARGEWGYRPLTHCTGKLNSQLISYLPYQSISTLLMLPHVMRTTLTSVL